MGYTVVYIGDVAATGWNEPANVAGFQQGSALPGRVGNTVVCGHSDAGGRVFARLPDLGTGDIVTLYVDGAAYRYRVAERVIVREAGVSFEERVANGKWISPTADNRLTLVTCVPASGAGERLILVARPVS